LKTKTELQSLFNGAPDIPETDFIPDNKENDYDEACAIWQSCGPLNLEQLISKNILHIEVDQKT
jgi:hypothetical protein